MQKHSLTSSPDQGQGAGQAIEDAASLAVILPMGVALDSIPARLKLYEKCRYKRASEIQELSRLIGRDLGSGPPVDAKSMTNYNFGHDEWDYSSQMLREWEWSQNPSLLWRMPTAFGPMPGPRQDHYGRPHDNSKGTFKTASMKFRTSKTVLQNMLPTKGNLKFAAPDTTAYATFAVTQLDNMEWLGGKGYNHFGLYIHGVQHTATDGSTVQGTYLPILFENLANPILSGRDELGFPKLFADLNLTKGTDEWNLQAGWMDSSFCKMTLSDLQDAPATNGTAAVTEASEHVPAPPQDTGLLVHKYFPATSPAGSRERGQADVEYTAFLSNAEDAKTVERKVERTLKAGSASISFDALDWKALPTLHHVVARLQEVPVYEVVEAKIVEGSGVSDVSPMKRLA